MLAWQIPQESWINSLKNTKIHRFRGARSVAVTGLSLDLSAKWAI
jgi:hypothetical protein